MYFSYCNSSTTFKYFLNSILLLISYFINIFLPIKLCYVFDQYVICTHSIIPLEKTAQVKQITFSDELCRKF